MNAEAVLERLAEHAALVDDVMRTMADQIAELTALTAETVQRGGTEKPWNDC